MDFVAKQLHAGAVLKLNPCQGQGLALQAHIVAVRALDQAFNFLHMGRDRVTLQALLGAPHLALKVNILGAISRGIDVRQIAGNQFMTKRHQIQEMLQALHGGGFNPIHAALRGGRPNSRILLRTVRRLTPSIPAARVRLPPVASRVFSRRVRSSSRKVSPGSIPPSEGSSF